MKKTAQSKFPSALKTVCILLLSLFSVEMLLMHALPYIASPHDPYVQSGLDAALLTILFAPLLYCYIFKPFQRIAAINSSLTNELMAHVVDGVLILDQELTIHSSNAAASEMFGYGDAGLAGGDARELLGDLVNLEPLPLPAGGISNAIRQGAGRRRDGSRIDVELSLSPIRMAGRWMWLGIIRDISTRIRNDEQIKQTLSLLGATLDATAEGVLVRDLAGRTVIYNRKFADLWNLPEEMVGSCDNRELRDFVIDQLKEPEKFLAVTERQYLSPEQETHEILTFNDGRFYERFSAPQVVDGEVVGQVISYRDVTEQKKLEHQLRHAQKMEALGTLAGGVAHDFNNILTVIMGFCDLTMTTVDGKTKHYMDQIMLASQKALSLTTRLLAYSRKQPMKIVPLELNFALQNTEKFLARLIGEEIELISRRSEEELVVMADRGQLEQVLMNLAANARDAMGRKGSLIIGTRGIEIDDQFIRLHGYGKPGRYAVISVSDTGVGIDEQTREKIFEPFFTTKEVGEGTGLGLSIVYGIVKQHDGYINVYSEPGTGTTFNIYLPLAEKGEQAVKAPQQQATGGSETLLVAEDDAAVRELVGSVLTASGYRVIMAANGEEAVQMFKEHADEVALLLLDVVMPKQNGREALEEIRRLKPSMKALFISGYTADIVDKNGLLQAGADLLMKPLLPNVLLGKLREMLDEGAKG